MVVLRIPLKPRGGTMGEDPALRLRPPMGLTNGSARRRYGVQGHRGNPRRLARSTITAALGLAGDHRDG